MAIQSRDALLAAVEEAASDWRRTFDAVEMPIIIAGPGATIARINRAARMLAGREYGELIGKPFAAAGDGEPWASAAELVSEVQTNRAPAARQVSETTGRTYDLLAMSFNADDPADTRVIVIAWDVTTLVDLQTRLEQQRTMATIGALVAGVAHEVRNPLFAISATVDAMEQAADGKLGEYFEVLRFEIDRMTALMQDLLAYGRPSTPDFRSVQLEDIVREALQMSRALAVKNQVELRAAVDSGLTVVADGDRLVRALQNLVDNAVQHSRSGETVVVAAAKRTAAKSVHVELRVEDSGKGFAADDLERVFEPFFSRRKGGTGLGLALVRQIVTEHGGHVTATNRSEGGAVVSMTLPLEQ